MTTIEKNTKYKLIAHIQRKQIMKSIYKPKELSVLKFEDVKKILDNVETRNIKKDIKEFLNNLEKEEKEEKTIFNCF